MGILDSFTDAIGGIIADQFLDAYTAQPFDEYTAISPAVPKDGEPISTKKSIGVIPNGSRIYVPENTAAVIIDQAGISEVLTEPGGYQYWNGRKTLFVGDDVGDILREQVKDRLASGGKLLDDKRVLFVNLREIRDVRFGTKGQQVYHDAFYDVDLSIRAFGNFSIKIIDAEKFIRNYVPANTEYYSFAEQQAKAQLVGELIQSFLKALNDLTASNRITELPSKAELMAKQIVQDSVVQSWKERFGIMLVNIAIQNIELSDESKALVNKFASKRMDVKAFEGVSQKAADISAQQNISQGIRDHGFGDGAGLIVGMNVAQGMVDVTKTNKMTLDEQMESIRKYKALFDEGILTEEEFQKKKTEILGL